jgi:hypothetical protein
MNLMSNADSGNLADDHHHKDACRGGCLVVMRERFDVPVPNICIPAKVRIITK